MVYAIPASCSNLVLSSVVAQLENETVNGLATTAAVPSSYISVVATVNTCWSSANGTSGGRKLSLTSVTYASGTVTFYTTITWPASVVAVTGISPAAAAVIATGCASPAALQTIFTPTVMASYGITSLPTATAPAAAGLGGRKHSMPNMPRNDYDP